MEIERSDLKREKAEHERGRDFEMGFGL